MVGHDNMGTIRDIQIVYCNPLSLNIRQFTNHVLWVNDSTSPHNTQTSWIKNPTRYQMKFEFTMLVNHCMSGVTPTLEPHTDIGFST